MLDTESGQVWQGIDRLDTEPDVYGWLCLVVSIRMLVVEVAEVRGSNLELSTIFLFHFFQR